MTADPRRERLRAALDGLWVSEVGTGHAVPLDDILDRLDRAELTTAASPAAVRDRVARYLDLMAEMKIRNARDSMAPGIWETGALTLRQAAEWCRDDSIWDDGEEAGDADQAVE